MAKEFAKPLYKSAAWKKCRQGYIDHRRAIDGGLCEVCKDNPGFIVHHKRPITPMNINDTDVTLNWFNLQYVCKHCHDVEHGYCGQDTRDKRVQFDSSGNAIPRRLNEER